ncbi:MAG: YceH family protein, partial [Bryobacterales bacterium]|nr:YceH family protein [Bryobacterales bacterium]
MESSEPIVPVLSAEEVRILGSLVEKELTTPDNYPLTLNSLLAACNQKTSRDPVMSLDTAAAERAIQSLKERGFVRSVSGAEHRVPKFKHDLPFMLRLNPAQTAVLTVLMLRGPQTIGEIRGRTDRMYSFHGLEEVAETIESLEDLNG